MTTAPVMSAEQMREPAAHTCAVQRTCTRRATTTASLGRGVIVWACDTCREEN